MNIQNILNEFCYHLKYMRGVSKLTEKRYRENISFFIRTCGVTDTSEVNQSKINSFFEFGKFEKNWMPATYRIYHQCLSSFFKWCNTREYMDINPMDNIEVPKLKKQLRERFTEKEAKRIISTVENYPYTSSFIATRNTAILYLFLYTGLRKKELLNLKLNDVNLNNQSLTINIAKGNSYRTIPISLSVNKVLHRYLKERMISKKTCPQFFCSSKKNVGYTDSGLKRLFNEIGRASGLRISSHKLRHTFATLMLEGGCDLFSLSRMMGHQDIQTTCIYLSASKHHLHNQMKLHPLSQSCGD